MEKVIIKPYNVIDQIELPDMPVEQLPTNGDPLEIKGELYYVCEDVYNHQLTNPVIGVIPLVIRNPAKVANIENYIKCLSIAHRKIHFKNAAGTCDLENCDEMVIS